MEGQKDDQMAGAPLLWRQSEKVGVAQLGEGSREMLLHSLSIPNGEL